MTTSNTWPTIRQLWEGIPEDQRDQLSDRSIDFCAYYYFDEDDDKTLPSGYEGVEGIPVGLFRTILEIGMVYGRDFAAFGGHNPADPSTILNVGIPREHDDLSPEALAELRAASAGC